MTFYPAAFLTMPFHEKKFTDRYVASYQSMGKKTFKFLHNLNTQSSEQHQLANSHNQMLLAIIVFWLSLQYMITA